MSEKNEGSDEPGDIETRLIVIAPTSQITPDQVTRFIHSLEKPISVKETCYGALIEGKRETVCGVLEEVRKMDPNRIFSKIRGFPMGDKRRCRAHHGSRPGFPQLQKEWEDLALFEQALECLDEEVGEPSKKSGKYSVEELKQLIEEV